MKTNEITVFPCNRWLSKDKEDGEIGRDLFPEIAEERRSYDGLNKSPRASYRELRTDDPFVTRTKRNDNYDDRPINKQRDWERTSSLRGSNNFNKEDFNFRDRDRNPIRSERDLIREHERDVYRSPRRNNF